MFPRGASPSAVSVSRVSGRLCAVAVGLQLVLGLVDLVATNAAHPSQTPPLTKEQQERLKERDRHVRQAQKLRQDGKRAEAIAAVERVLAIERQLFGAVYADVAASLEVLAELQEETDTFPAARKARQEVLTIQTRLFGERHWRTTEARLALANVDTLARLDPEQRRRLGEADRLGQLSSELNDQGKHRESLPLAQRAWALRQQVLGLEHRDTATNLNNLGVVQHDLGDHAAARRSHEQAFAIRKKVLGTDHPETADSLNNLGALFESIGDHPAARRYHEQALAVRQRVLGPDDPATAQSANNLAAVLKALGEYAAARSHYEHAIAVWKKTHGAEHPDTAIGLSNLGKLFQDMGDYAPARSCFESALATFRKVLGPEHPHTAAAHNNLGVLLQDTGDFPAARRHYEQSLAIRRKHFGPDHPSTAGSLHCLGAVLSELGDRAAARKHLEHALAIREQALGLEDSATAATRDWLVHVLQKQGDHLAARRHYEKALADCEKTHGPDHPETAEALTSLATSLWDMGDKPSARKHLERALAICQRAGRWEHPQTARTLAYLGVLLGWLDEPVQARARLEEALAIREKVLGPDHPGVVESQIHLGVQLAAARDESGARKHLAAAGALAARLTASLLASSTEREHGRLFDWRGQPFEMLLSLAEAAPKQAADDAPALLEGLWALKAASGQALRDRQEAIVLAGDTQATRLHADLLQSRQRLAQAMMRGPGAEPAASYRSRLERLRTEQEAHEQALARQVADFAVLREARQAGLEAVARQLPAGAVLVELVRYDPFRFRSPGGRKGWGPARYAALLLERPPDNDRKPAVRIAFLGAAEPIDRVIRDWRAAAQEGPIDRKFDDSLRQRLWEPLAQVLLAGTTRLLIAPDGALGLVPFEAIRLADGKYLVERYQVSYLSSGRDLMPRPQAPGKPGPALVLADPDYDAVPDHPSTHGAGQPQLAGQRSGDMGQRGMHLRRLPGFAREADAVVRALTAKRDKWPVERRLGQKATEEELTAVARPRLLYLITHGFFLSDLDALRAREGSRGLELVPIGDKGPRLPAFREDPRLRSGLALAGANRWQERAAKGNSDGLLTALEVQNLDLWGTELVVLSACETGLGEVQVGEGVLGLRRAFQIAGAETVLASLWKVPDTETEKLMTRFLDSWLSGKAEGKANALRAAQLHLIEELRKEKDPKRKEAPPLLWAGFICHGRPD